MTLLDQEIADITSLDGGDVFIGGRYHSLLPILQDVYESNELHVLGFVNLIQELYSSYKVHFLFLWFADGDKFYYSVAVIKKGNLSDVSNLYHLRSKKACFPGVGSLAGWVIPIETVMFAS